MKIALAVSSGMLVLIVGFGVLLERTIESEAFQASLREEIEWTFAGASEWADVEWAGAEAHFISSSLTLDRPEIRLGRDSDGRNTSSLRWLAGSGEAKLDLASLLAGHVQLRSLRLSQGALEVRKRWRSHTSTTWHLEDLELFFERETAKTNERGPFPFRVTGRLSRGLDDPIPISAEARLIPQTDGGLLLTSMLDFGSHGRARLSATRVAPDSPFGLAVDLDQLDVALLPALFSRSSLEIEGRATGSVEVGGEVRSPDHVEIDVLLEDANLHLPEYSVEGTVPAVVTIDDAFSERPRGRMELELTEARLDFRGRFEKPAGQRASVTTTFGPDGEGGTEFESRVSLRDLHQLLTPAGPARVID